ncbi:MAG: alcohol dehydrogenase catalytic domain-containing protein [Spirochaetaceae bacterium]|jgi:2-desacetyl-2-hydroxyethyl bacteriochlorophyllide A dehydrogenase|nr:alcohol dehydrogenase catalytic domain-containing protein [Spirochaetaceae bacterium]
MSRIPEKMKALVAHAPGDYRLELIPTPRARGDEVIVKVEGCGVCAGDTKAYAGAKRFWGGGGTPSYIKAPVVPGHEFVGTVVEAGPDQKEFVPGDRVVSEQIVPCGECRYCRTGRYWMCQKHDVYGFQNNVNGGMAEYMRYPHEGRKHKIPREMPLEQALLIEPFGCSKHCVDRAEISNEDFVVLSGAGTLGLGMVGAIRKRNPAVLVVLDKNDLRLAKAKEFGADIVLNPGRENVIEKILAMTEGYGCDIYIEASGHSDSVGQGLEMIRKMGRFVEFSVFKEPATVDWSIIGDQKELDIRGAHLSPDCYPWVIKWILDGSLPTAGVVTHQFPLEDWQKAFDLALTGGDNAIKVAIIP